MRGITRALVVLSWTLMTPAIALAQASMTGVVKDTSGAVLPGVTVEASSPALIEKVRSAVTDGNGRYQIVDLRPGAYRVTFALPGFSTVAREGIELTGSSAARIDADLRVGSLEETVTVTSDAPTVDVQTVTREQVLSSDLIDALPSARNYVTLARMIPGTVGGGSDVGGSELQGTGGSVTIHGSRAVDQRVTLNGINTMTLQAGGNVGGQIPDVGSAQEVTVDSAALSAELSTGGVRINFIPRDGGNTWANSGFFTFSNGALQGSNFTDKLKSAGLTTPNEIKQNWDLNESFGGPIRRDRLWFWFSSRVNHVENYLPIFENTNAFDPTQWLYEPDTSRRGINAGRSLNSSVRVTWQASPRNKIAATYKADRWCQCPNFVSATRAPEAAHDRRFPRLRQEHAEWTSPVTNRLLVEAVGLHLFERWGNMELQSKGSLDDSAAAARLPLLISVQEQSSGLIYRAGGIGVNPSPLGYNNTLVPNFSYRAAVSYVTGTHNFKVGFNRTHGYLEQETYNFQPYQYRFNNGVPNQVTLYATPFTAKSNEDNDLGLFAQDRWTLDKLTLGLALRYDYFGTSFPEQHVGPGPLVPNRNITFPASDNLAWKDLTYRTGASYDVRGDGKTAVKVTFNKYLLGQTLNALGTTPNPVNTLVNSATRAWTDANRNFAPDCDLINPVANGECGPTSPATFGSTRPAEAFDPDLLTGWGHRQANWEFSAGVQHEILPRVAIDVGYFRRFWGNFQVTDNLAVGPGDFTQFQLTVPGDPRLPGGGGQTLTGLYDVSPAKFGQQQNYNTLSDKFGKQIEHFDGFDVNLSARLQSGLMLQGGTSTGRTLEDNCEIVAKLPEMLNLTGAQASLTAATPAHWRPAQFCRRATPWQTQLKMYGVYTVPKIDVQFAATLRSTPGAEINAAFVATNAYLTSSSTLGRPLAGGAANMTVGLLAPNSRFVDRRNELDMRFGKVLRAGKSRSVVSLDVYNALNTDALINVNQSFAIWMRPTEILSARLLKLSVQFDF